MHYVTQNILGGGNYRRGVGNQDLQDTAQQRSQKHVTQKDENVPDFENRNKINANTEMAI